MRIGLKYFNNSGIVASRSTKPIFKPADLHGFQIAADTRVQTMPL